MTIDASESGTYTGAPLEVYRFMHAGAVYRFTGADENVIVAGETYEPILISRDEVDQSNEDWAGSVTVTVARDNPVSLLFVPYLPIEPVGLFVYRRHRGETDFVPIFVGKVSSAAWEGSEAMLTCMPVGEALRRSTPGLAYQVPCNHCIYTNACGVNKELFKVSGAVSAISGETITAAAFATKPDGWFTTGFVQRANGDMRFIVSHSGPTVTLMSPFPDLHISEILPAYAGCDRTELTCETKFNNLPNHLGWARIPTLNPYNTDISGMGGSGGSIMVIEPPTTGPIWG